MLTNFLYPQTKILAIPMTVHELSQN